MLAVAAVIHRFRFLLIGLWLLLAAGGAVAAPRAVTALTYDFSLPGQRGFTGRPTRPRQLVATFSTTPAPPNRRHPPQQATAVEDPPRRTPQVRR